eukprot:2395786-Alexandrium_andersonii.AAC.1
MVWITSKSPIAIRMARAAAQDVYTSSCDGPRAKARLAQCGAGLLSEAHVPGHFCGQRLCAHRSLVIVVHSWAARHPD